MLLHFLYISYFVSHLTPSPFFFSSHDSIALVILQQSDQSGNDGWDEKESLKASYVSKKELFPAVSTSPIMYFSYFEML